MENVLFIKNLDVFSLQRSTGTDGGYNELKKAFAQC